MKKLIILLVFALLPALLSACGKQGETSTSAPTESGETTSAESSETLSETDYGFFSVYTMSVGKADCMVLKTKNHAVVIDLGVKEKAESIVAFLQRFAPSVDALLISHYDKDHIGAIKKFTSKYSPSAVYLPEYEDEKPENADEVRSYLIKHNFSSTVVTSITEFAFDGVVFTVYPTDIFFKRNDNGSNESSLVLTARHGDNLFLFAGDAEARRLPEIVEQLPDPEAVDYLKVPHHGVCDDNSEAFFNALKPTCAVITCSAAEPADGSTVLLLERVGAQVYMTSEHSVKAVSNGLSIALSYFDA